MEAVRTDHLSEALEAVNEAFFLGTPIPAGQRRETARFIASRQGLPGAYADTFALDEEERRVGIQLFTGERATSAAARHIAGQEACRALRLLGVRETAVRHALDTATAHLALRIGSIRQPTGSSHWFDPYLGGVYCCGRCSVAFWRHLTAGGFDGPEDRLAVGLRCLRTRRKEDHTWAVFPFWYTLSALIEMPADLTRPELRRVAPRLEAALKRRSGTAPHAQRRQEIARRALALV